MEETAATAVEIKEATEEMVWAEVIWEAAVVAAGADDTRVTILDAPNRSADSFMNGQCCLKLI